MIYKSLKNSVRQLQNETKRSNRRHKYIMKEGKDVRKLQRSYEREKYLSI